MAALRSLQKIGDAHVIPALWEIAAGPDALFADTAKETLTALPGDKSNEAIVAKLESPDAANQILALELIGRRRIQSAVPQLLKLATSADVTLKCAALRALGETVSLEQVPVLVTAVIAARSDTEKAETQTALTAACVRMPDRDACARMLTDKLASAPDEAKTVLLEQLGAMGGPVALACLADCAKDARRRYAGCRDADSGHLDRRRCRPRPAGPGPHDQQREVQDPRAPRLHPHRQPVRTAPR